MKTILALYAIFALGSLIIADPITVTATPGQLVGAQFAADQYNATAKTDFDAATKAAYEAAQAALPADQRVPYDAAKAAQYVPLTAIQYEAWRFSQVLDSHAEQERQARINAPAAQALIDLAARAMAGKTAEQQAAIMAGMRAQLPP